MLASDGTKRYPPHVRLGYSEPSIRSHQHKHLALVMSQPIQSKSCQFLRYHLPTRNRIIHNVMPQSYTFVSAIACSHSSKVIPFFATTNSQPSFASSSCASNC